MGEQRNAQGAHAERADSDGMAGTRLTSARTCPMMYLRNRVSGRHARRTSIEPSMGGFIVSIEKAYCVVCGRVNERCAFEYGCSCWRGIPCAVVFDEDDLPKDGSEDDDVAMLRDWRD